MNENEKNERETIKEWLEKQDLLDAKYQQEVVMNPEKEETNDAP